MSDQLRESLSALMDGESQELELRRLLSADGEDKEVVEQTWSRYHLAREAMHDSSVNAQFRHLDISQQVSMAVRDEPVVQAKRSKSWLQPVAGFAVAASVAAGVVIGVQSTGSVTPGFNNGVPVAEQPAVASSSRVYPVAIQGTGSGSLQASGNIVGYPAQMLPSASALKETDAEAALATQQRLDRLMLRHTERAALDNGQGMASFARVSNYEIPSDGAK